MANISASALLEGASRLMAVKGGQPIPYGAIIHQLHAAPRAGLVGQEFHRIYSLLANNYRAGDYVLNGLRTNRLSADDLRTIDFALNYFIDNAAAIRAGINQKLTVALNNFDLDLAFANFQAGVFALARKDHEMAALYFGEAGETVSWGLPANEMASLVSSNASLAEQKLGAPYTFLVRLLTGQPFRPIVAAPVAPPPPPPVSPVPAARPIEPAAPAAPVAPARPAISPAEAEATFRRLMTQADEALSRGRFLEALKNVTQALRYRPEHAAAKDRQSKLLGRCYQLVESGDDEDKLNNATAIVDAKPDEWRARLLVARILITSREVRIGEAEVKALTHLAAAQEYAPAGRAAQEIDYLMARALHKLQREAEALAVFERIGHDHPFWRDALRPRFYAMLSANQVAAAEDYLHANLAFMEKNEPVFYLEIQARILRAKGQLTEALELARQAQGKARALNKPKYAESLGKGLIAELTKEIVAQPVPEPVIEPVVEPPAPLATTVAAEAALAVLQQQVTAERTALAAREQALLATAGEAEARNRAKAGELAELEARLSSQRAELVAREASLQHLTEQLAAREQTLAARPAGGRSFSEVVVTSSRQLPNRLMQAINLVFTGDWARVKEQITAALDHVSGQPEQIARSILFLLEKIIGGEQKAHIDGLAQQIERLKEQLEARKRELEELKRQHDLLLAEVDGLRRTNETLQRGILAATGPQKPATKVDFASFWEELAAMDRGSLEQLDPLLEDLFTATSSGLGRSLTVPQIIERRRFVYERIVGRILAGEHVSSGTLVLDEPEVTKFLGNAHHFPHRHSGTVQIAAIIARLIQQRQATSPA